MLSNFFPLILFEFALVANFSVFGKRGIVWPPYRAKPKLAATVAIIAFVALPFFAAQWLFRSEVHDVSVPWTVTFNLVPAGLLLIAHHLYDAGIIGHD